MKDNVIYNRRKENRVIVKMQIRSVVGLFVLYWKVFVWTVVITIAFLLTNSTTFLPLSGFYLLGYVLIISIATIWLCSILLQNFLHHKHLFNIKFESLGELFKPPENERTCDTKALAIDIDENFIRKWFVYISNERTFNEESEVILEDVLRKIVNVQRSLENEIITHGCLNLYLKHLKEFRRALKRKEKYGGRIYELYSYSHTSSDSTRAKEYFMHQLTSNLLNHFINWELSNSLPYRVLVSIVARKVMSYALELLSNPEFLNYCILNACASQEKRKELKLQDYTRIKLNWAKYDEENVKTETDNAPVVDDSIKTVDNDTKEPLDIPKTDAHRTTPDYVVEADTCTKKATPPKLAEIVKKSEQVKIHEPFKSCKTWYNSCDLESVTLGQDILDLIEEDSSDREEEELSPLSSAKSLLDEVKHITSIEGIKTSMKPISDATTSTFNNIKDFQESTVNNVMKPMSQATSTALHRIGGLHLQDEAAGVVEGLLDFGRTKIRKGLRLTGLQDPVIEEPHKLPLQKRNVPKISQLKSQDKNDNFESAWINPLLEDSPAKTDYPEDLSRFPYKVPSIARSHGEMNGSPDPEYEDTADLATSIAKLRSLLEQKTTESALSTPALSPMPPDEFVAKILESEDEVDGMMPSFYKFCAKTATGVLRNTLNTVKTALPGNMAESDRFQGQWLFIESPSPENELFERMDKVLNERQVFCTVDAAYEAIDSLAPSQLRSTTANLGRSNIQFEDELDDFEVKIPVTKALLDIFCELLADTEDSTFSQEPVIKSVLLLFGSFVEETVLTQTNALVNYWCANAKIPAESRAKTLKLDLDEFVGGVLSGTPDYLKHLANESVLKQAITLLVSSLQVQKVNEDMFMQIFEILCMKLIEGSKQMSPIPEFRLELN